MMNYHKITRFDTANGPGIRTTLWVSGCEHKCKGCQNPETWNPSSGHLFTTSTLYEILDSLEPDYIRGLTVSGGDPFHPDNIEGLWRLLGDIRKVYPNKDIWVWTGYLYEDLLKIPGLDSLLSLIDVLVDGPFILEDRDITHPYHGSPNQRVIDIKKTRDNCELILYDESNYKKENK